MSRASELAVLMRAMDYDDTRAAADEMERLERVNAELVEAMRQLIEGRPEGWDADGWFTADELRQARAALTSATKEQQK